MYSLKYRIQMLEEMKQFVEEVSNLFEEAVEQIEGKFESIQQEMEAEWKKGIRMKIQKGTKVKIIATIEELHNEGIDEPFASDLIGAEGKIVGNPFGNTFSIDHHGTIWVLERNFFEIADNL